MTNELTRQVCCEALAIVRRKIASDVVVAPVVPSVRLSSLPDPFAMTFLEKKTFAFSSK